MPSGRWGAQVSTEPLGSMRSRNAETCRAIRKSRRFRALRDLEVNCLAYQRAPFTGGEHLAFRSHDNFHALSGPPANATVALRVRE